VYSFSGLSDEEKMEREPCLHCGMQIAKDGGVTLKTVMLLARIPPDERVATIVRSEGITGEAAQEYLDHKMGGNCVKTEPPCPSCGAALRTWHATGCWGCGWRRDANRQLPDYYRDT